MNTLFCYSRMEISTCPLNWSPSDWNGCGKVHGKKERKKEIRSLTMAFLIPLQFNHSHILRFDDTESLRINVFWFSIWSNVWLWPAIKTVSVAHHSGKLQIEQKQNIKRNLIIIINTKRKSIRLDWIGWSKEKTIRNTQFNI